MKEKLKNYRALKLELEDVNAQINSGTVQDSVQASQSEHPLFQLLSVIIMAVTLFYNIYKNKK